MADETGSSDTNWPLRRISEPHENNDVILSLPQHLQHRDAVKTNDNVADSSTRDTVPPAIVVDPLLVPWRSDWQRDGNHNSTTQSPTRRTKSDASYLKYLRGNQRFLELLDAHQEEYEHASAMEKPLVALKLLNKWREQSPPGRFLVTESDTDPPLWKDVGDKKARSKISKALKQKVVMTRKSSSLSLSAATDSLDGGEVAAALNAATTPTELNTEFETRTRKFAESHGRRSLSEEQKMHDHSCDFEEEEHELELYGKEYHQSQEIISQPQLKSTGGASRIAEEEEKKGAEDSPQSQAFPLHPSQKLLTIGSRRPAIPRFKKADRGSRRISEQLNLAQEDGKIYGRWKERDQLVLVYQHQREQYMHYLKDGENTSSCATDFVLISGTMGVGKSSLAQTLRNPLLDENSELERPFFLRGKYEHCKWSDANAVFIQVIADFCQQLLQLNDPKLTRQYREAIQRGLQDDVSLIINLVPKLEALWEDEQRSSVTSASESLSRSKRRSSTSVTTSCKAEAEIGCMAMERIKGVLRTFFEAIATVLPEQQSIIVLLDDLHYASETALDILLFLLADRAHCGVLFLSTYRTDEETDPHFGSALQRLDSHHNVVLHKIALDNLPEDSVHFMLSETLSLPTKETLSLTKSVHALSKGNPTFINEVLRDFQDKELLRYDEDTKLWTCDVDNIQLALEDRKIHSVFDLFQAKLYALPSTIQESLKIAACLWSNRVDEKMLKLIDTVGAVSSHLKYAAMKGILHVDVAEEGHYLFVSDGVKQAIYESIPKKERGAFHLRIARRLWLHLQDNQNAEFYSNLMTQLFMGDHLIKQEEDRRAVAMVYLDAGRKAAVHLGFQTSWYCLSKGISMVSSLQKPWGRDNYDISLSLHNTALEVCYSNGQFDELESLISQVLENARTFEDSLLARTTLIYALGSRNKQPEAIKMAMETLEEVGEVFSSMYPSALKTKLAGYRLKKKLCRLSDQEMLSLKRMKNPKKLAAMQILNHVLLYTFYASPNLLALMAFRMVELTLDYGLCAMSSVAVAMYGSILCRFGHAKEGFRYGELGIKISKTFEKEVWLCRTYAVFYGTVYGSKASIVDVVEPLQYASRAGMRTGDVEFAVLNACIACWTGCEVLTLPVLENKLRETAGIVDKYGQTLAMVMIKPLWQEALNLMGRCPGDPKVMQGEILSDVDKESEQESFNPHFVYWIRFTSMRLAYLFSDYDLAEKYGDTTKWLYRHPSSSVDGAYTLFYQCMVRLAQAQRGKRRYRSIYWVRRKLKLFKSWATSCPINFLGKYFFIQGELAATCGKSNQAIMHYRSAILHSREAGLLSEEALGNEQLAKLYIECGDIDSAICFLKAARSLYEKWGAKAKVEHFDNTYCQYLELASIPLVIS